MTLNDNNVEQLLSFDEFSIKEFNYLHPVK
jgi:hypothetical protein